MEFEDRAPKRPRMEDRGIPDNSDQHYRRRSPPGQGRMNDSYRPNRGRGSNRPYGPRGRRPAESYRPQYQDPAERRRSASPPKGPRAEITSFPKNKKSNRDRKENPSTRIHSLRNLLNRDTLPATVRQEKERELAALLFDQQKATIKSVAKKNLQRYHFIRFVERQKAVRTLKKLKKQQESQSDNSEELQKQIHEAEVDVNYCIYAPLAQKYIAIYARGEDNPVEGKRRPLSRNLSKMNRKDYALLSEEQQYEIEQESMEAANLLHIAEDTTGMKPPMWYIVEAKMLEGEEALQALRDEQAKVNPMTEMVVGAGQKRKDVESEDSDDGGVGVDIGNQDEVWSDEDEEMGDGGFFERR